MPDSGIEQKVDKLYLDFYIGDGKHKIDWTKGQVVAQ